MVSSAGFLDLEPDDREDDEAFDGIDSELKPHRYYTSKKTLGVLYRNIDEGEFLDNMQKARRDRMTIQASAFQSNRLMNDLLRYVQHWTSQYGIIYDHHRKLATEIRAEYVSHIRLGR